MASSFLQVVPTHSRGLTVCQYKLVVSGGELNTQLPIVVTNANNPQLGLVSQTYDGAVAKALDPKGVQKILGWHNYQTASGELTFTIGTSLTEKKAIDANSLGFQKLLDNLPFVVGMPGYNITVASTVTLEAIVYVATGVGRLEY